MSLQYPVLQRTALEHHLATKLQRGASYFDQKNADQETESERFHFVALCRDMAAHVLTFATLRELACLSASNKELRSLVSSKSMQLWTQLHRRATAAVGLSHPFVFRQNSVVLDVKSKDDRKGSPGGNQIFQEINMMEEVADSVARIDRPRTYRSDEYRIVVCGQRQSGVSALTDMFVEKKMRPDAQNDVDLRVRRMSVEIVRRKRCTTTVDVHVMDKRNSLLVTPFSFAMYSGRVGVAIVFDLTNSQAVQGVDDQLKLLSRATALNTSKNANEATDRIAKVMIGTKADVADKRMYTYEQARNLAAERGLRYVETSASTGYGVDFAFNSLIYEVDRRSHKY